ncbi:uncharacterized protein LOC131034550 isoform X2 [Cryptomeria japonica]|uniref:uncharacterized protein LOC131034550 isoform X2 n=1 Tax=Cryptomeria japonica TaxID=3369 RepID=UPI0027DA283D|nr:uncharacterized protein LOC131034550 isoform X2 [Cryptomeria japonica]
MQWWKIGRARYKPIKEFVTRNRNFSGGTKNEAATSTVVVHKTPAILAQPPPNPPSKAMLYFSAGLLSTAAVGGAFVLTDEEAEAKVRTKMEEGFHRLEEAKEKVSERAASLYRRCVETGVAAAVLLKSLRSMLSSANEEAKLGLKMRVAALLADLAGANESRRRAIVAAGGGAVVDWLFDTLSSPSTPPLTQAEAARALSFLISDSVTCEAVLARPLAISHLFRFIYSIHPHSAKNPKRTNLLHVNGEVLQGKSMLVAAIMDIVTTSCDNPSKKVFRPRLPECADLRDIAAALQVIEEGGLELDEPHDGDDDDNDDRKGMRGIGIKVLGGTAVIGLLRFHDFSRLEFPFLRHWNNYILPHSYFTHCSFSSNHLSDHDIIKNLSAKGGSSYVSIPSGSTNTVASNEKFDYPGLWDDLQSRHVAVPLAAWALASWASVSGSNRSKIAELDRDGHAVMTSLAAPERTVKWHGALIARLLMEDKSVPVVDFGAEWSSSLLAMAVQACKAQDIPLVRVALSSFFVTIERSTNAQKVVMDKGLKLIREISKQTQTDQEIQEVLAKAIELLWTTGSPLSLEESKQWSGILLRWVSGRHSVEGTRSSAATVLTQILEEHGPNAIIISQAWLTLLLSELIGLCKITPAKRTTTSSNSTEVKASSNVQSQIIQSAVQSATQLVGIIAYTAEKNGVASPDSTESQPTDDLLMLTTFSEYITPKKKDRPINIDAADSALATLKGIKALTELCSENHTYQKRIIESGGLCLLRRFMLSDDYEQLAATEVYDASRLLEGQDQVSTPVDKSAISKENNSSTVRVPPTAHIRKHAARLLTILSLQSEASKLIAKDEAWCKWLEDCANGKISGCNDPKIRSYARSTLLNISNTNYNGNNHAFDSGKAENMVFQRNMCPRYEDMIFLINPEASYHKCQAFQAQNMPQNSAVNVTNTDYSANNVDQGIGGFEEDSKPGVHSKIPQDTFQEMQEEADPLLDVVFVHGLRGGPFNTWRLSDNKASTTSKSGLVEKIDEDSGREGTCWPREWLAADLPRTRLLTVKYKTNLSQWSGATLPLEEVSLMLLKKLVAAGIGERPVVFVTHRLS